MALRRQWLEALATKPGKGRLPNLGRGAAVARGAQLHDGGHRHLFPVQADFHAGDAPFAFAYGKNRALARVELVGILIETVVERRALADEILYGSQRHEGEARNDAAASLRASPSWRCEP